MKELELVRGYSDGDVDTNRTDSKPLHAIVNERYSRRQTMSGGLKASAAAFLGTTMLAAGEATPARLIEILDRPASRP